MLPNESNKPTQQSINFWLGENVVYTIFKANAWRGVTADNFPVVLVFQKKTYIEQLLCYHLLLILNLVTIIIAFVPVDVCTLKFGEKNLLSFFQKMHIQRFSPYRSAVISEKCVVTPSFLFGFQ